MNVLGSYSSDKSTNCKICSNDGPDDCEVSLNELKEKCNKHLVWIENKFCRFSCYNVGSGYAEDICCNEIQSPTFSLTTRYQTKSNFQDFVIASGDNDVIVSSDDTCKNAWTQVSIVKSKKIGEVCDPSNQFNIECVINPSEPSYPADTDIAPFPRWISIFRFASNPSRDMNEYVDRAPALFFHPGTLLLYLVIGSKKNTNNYVSSWKSLIPDKDNNVRIEAIGDEIKLVVNDEYVGVITLPLSECTNITEGLHFFAGDMFYEPANATIESLSWTNFNEVLVS